MITGGAGFIGSAVVRNLLHNTDIIVGNLDKLTYAGNLDSIFSVSCSKNYRFYHVDICDREAVDRVLEEFRPTVIMHLAAESHVDRSIDGPVEFVQTNIIGTYNLLEAARVYWKELDCQAQEDFRFHHVSTDEVYGDLPHPDDYVDNTRVLEDVGSLPLFTESTPYAPSSPYSASKASSDHLVRAWHRTYGLPIVVTNCSNNYGPYHFPEKLIPHLIINALLGKSLPVYGDGNQIRDWLYVEDHARALIRVVEAGQIGETYNIGGHNEKRNIEVVRDICSLLEELAADRKPNKVQCYEDLIVFVDDRPGHDVRYAIDSTKMKRELGWSPEETFETGLRKTVQWYLDNMSWWQSVLDGSYKLERLGREE